MSTLLLFDWSIFTQASTGKAQVMRCFQRPSSQAFLAQNGDENERTRFLLGQHNMKNAMFCEERVSQESLLKYVHLTYKDIDCFRNGWVYELNCLTASQISKVYAHSCVITNAALTNSNYETTGKSYGYHSILPRHSLGLSRNIPRSLV